MHFLKKQNHQFEWEIYIRNPRIHTFNEAKVIIRGGHYSLVKTDDFDFFNTYWAICIFSKNKNHQFEWEIYINNPGVHTFNEAKVDILGAFGGHFESRSALQGRLGALLGRLEALLGRLGALLGRLGETLGRLGALLGRFGAPLGRLGALWNRLGALLGRLGALLVGHLVSSGGPLDSSGRPLGRCGGLWTAFGQPQWNIGAHFRSTGGHMSSLPGSFASLASEMEPRAKTLVFLVYFNDFAAPRAPL